MNYQVMDNRHMSLRSPQIKSNPDGWEYRTGWLPQEHTRRNWDDPWYSGSSGWFDYDYAQHENDRHGHKGQNAISNTPRSTPRGSNNPIGAPARTHENKEPDKKGMEAGAFIDKGARKSGHTAKTRVGGRLLLHITKPNRVTGCAQKRVIRCPTPNDMG